MTASAQSAARPTRASGADDEGAGAGTVSGGCMGERASLTGVIGGGERGFVHFSENQPRFNPKNRARSKRRFDPLRFVRGSRITAAYFVRGSVTTRGRPGATARP